MQVAAGGEHTIVLTASGRLFACGQSEYGQLGILDENVEREGHLLSHIDVKLGGLVPDKVVEVACGVHHCIAVGSTGNVRVLILVS